MKNNTQLVNPDTLAAKPQLGSAQLWALSQPHTFFLENPKRTARLRCLAVNVSLIMKALLSCVMAETWNETDKPFSVSASWGIVHNSKVSEALGVPVYVQLQAQALFILSHQLKLHRHHVFYSHDGEGPELHSRRASSAPRVSVVELTRQDPYLVGLILTSCSNWRCLPWYLLQGFLRSHSAPGCLLHHLQQRPMVFMNCMIWLLSQDLEVSHWLKKCCLFSQYGQ